MQGCYLKFYVQERRLLHGVPAHDWILQKARQSGLPGGSAFRAIAGYGRHGVLHEDHFFELAGDLPVEVGFAVTDAEADRFLALVAAEGVSLPWLRVPIEFGITGEADPAAGGPA